MNGIEIVTIFISCIAIGVAASYVVGFVALSRVQRKLVIRGSGPVKVPQETASVMGILAESYADDVPENEQKILSALVLRYSDTSLVNVFSDDIERSYLFEVLGDPSRIPWKTAEELRGSKVPAAKTR